MDRFLHVCRTLHGWLGVFIMPWVVVVGATGLYFNHVKLIYPLFQQEKFSESGFERAKPAASITRESARLLGEKLWPDQPIKRISRKAYHGRPSYFVRKDRGDIILSIPTGHYYLKTRYTRRTFSPEGKLLHAKTYWGRRLKDLHKSGWMGGGLGTWLADIVAIAVMIFGSTGLLMWTAPRVRRLRRRSQPRPSTANLSENPS